MFAWIVQHWVGVTTGVGVLIAVIWWIAKPPSWRDGEGDNNSLVDAGSFRQFH
jgi:hypothetical protein